MNYVFERRKCQLLEYCTNKIELPIKAALSSNKSTGGCLFGVFFC